VLSKFWKIVESKLFHIFLATSQVTVCVFRIRFTLTRKYFLRHFYNHIGWLDNASSHSRQVTEIFQSLVLKLSTHILVILSKQNLWVLKKSYYIFLQWKPPVQRSNGLILKRMNIHQTWQHFPVTIGEKMSIAKKNQPGNPCQFVVSSKERAHTDNVSNNKLSTVLLFITLQTQGNVNQVNKQIGALITGSVNDPRVLDYKYKNSSVRLFSRPLDQHHTSILLICCAGEKHVPSRIVDQRYTVFFCW
jgi:hypothetical protein